MCGGDLEAPAGARPHLARESGEPGAGSQRGAPAASGAAGQASSSLALVRRPPSLSGLDLLQNTASAAPTGSDIPPLASHCGTSCVT